MKINIDKPIVVTSSINNFFKEDVKVERTYPNDKALVSFYVTSGSTYMPFEGVLNLFSGEIEQVVYHPIRDEATYSTVHLIFDNKGYNEQADKFLNMSEEELAEYAKEHYKYSIEDSRGYKYRTFLGAVINADYFLDAGCKNWESFDDARRYYTKGTYNSTGDLEEINMIIDALERVWNKAQEKPKDKWVRVLKSVDNSTLGLLPSTSELCSSDLKELKEKTVLDSVVGFYNMTTGELVAHDKED